MNLFANSVNPTFTIKGFSNVCIFVVCLPVYNDRNTLRPTILLTDSSVLNLWSIDSIIGHTVLLADIVNTMVSHRSYSTMRVTGLDACLNIVAKFVSDISIQRKDTYNFHYSFDLIIRHFTYFVQKILSII